MSHIEIHKKQMHATFNIWLAHLCPRCANNFFEFKKRPHQFILSNKWNSPHYPIFLICLFYTKYQHVPYWEWMRLKFWISIKINKILFAFLLFCTVTRESVHTRQTIGRGASKMWRSPISYRWGNNLRRQWNGKQQFFFLFFEIGTKNCKYFPKSTREKKTFSKLRKKIG